MLLITLRRLRRLARFFWGSLAVVIIILAVVVTIGRKTLPLLHEHRNQVAEFVSARLGVQVQIGAIEGAWRGFRPRLKIHHLHITSAQQQPIVSAELVETQIDLPSLLWDWRLAFRKVQFSGVRASFNQHEDGRWSVNGLALSAPRKREFSLRDPLDIFLFGKRIQLNNARLDFNFRTGHATQVVLPQILLENDDDFHRLRLGFAVDTDQKALTLVVEGRGDPRDDENFQAKGYLSLEHFPMEKVVAATALAAWQHLDQGRWSDGARVNLKLWFDGNLANGFALTGKLVAQDVPLKLPANLRLPERTEANITGRWQPDAGWQLVLGQLQFHWPEASSPAVNLSLGGKLGESLLLALDRFDVTAWRQLATQLDLHHPILDGLAPEGTLTNIRLRQASAEEGYFDLEANLTDLGIYSLNGSPQIRHVDGYLHTSANGGTLDLASEHAFSMHYPSVYREPLDYDSAHGQLRWALDKANKQVLVSSSRLSLRGAEGPAEGHLYLALPTEKTPTSEPLMELVVGLKNSQASFHKKYVPYTVNPRLLGWLDQAIKEGDLIDGGFIYRGSLLKTPITSRSMQLYLNVENARLAFDPHWPELTEVKARLVMDDSNLRVDVSEGLLEGNRVSDTQVWLAREPGLTLAMEGQMQGTSQAALNLLKNSPVANLIGDALNQLSLSGQMQGAIGLRVPLAEDGANWQEVAVEVRDNRLDLVGLNLGFSALTGVLRYSSEDGLTSSGMLANLWGEPMSASIGKNDSGNLIKAQGQVTVSALNQWLKRPELNYAHGRTEVAAEIQLPSFKATGDRALKLAFTSDLRGVGFNAPVPLAKLPADSLPFKGAIRLDKSTQEDTYQFSIGTQADLLMRRRAGKLDAVGVRLLDAVARPLQSGQTLVDIAYPQARLSDWQDFTLGYIALLSLTNASAPSSDLNKPALALHSPTSRPTANPLVGLAPAPPENPFSAEANPSLPVDLQLQLDSLEAGSLTLAPFKAKLHQQAASWNLDFVTPSAQGIVSYRTNTPGAPWLLHLSALNLPDSASRKDEGKCTPFNTSGDLVLPPSALADVQPASLPAAEVHIDRITQAGKLLGALSFNVEPIAQGLKLSQLRGRIYAMQLLGFNHPDAELTWTQQNGKNITNFDARLRTVNLADVLEAMDEPASISSAAASMNSSLIWNGAPDQGGMASYLGFVQLDIQNGAFIKGVNSGANPLLKLLGFMNFDNLGRRLRFDFTDLNTKGMAFDQVTGRIDFNRGQLLLAEPLKVESASTQLKLAGTLDVATQNVNANLVATLPVSGNLTLAAAMTGALPVAAGVFLAGKIFKKQLDKASSLKYKVRGPWQDPDITLQTIFDDETGTEVEAPKKNRPRKAKS
ncbi:MAG TPA: YhdP family protein [Cellvibrionaceae bacterium]